MELGDLVGWHGVASDAIHRHTAILERPVTPQEKDVTALMARVLIGCQIGRHQHTYIKHRLLTSPVPVRHPLAFMHQKSLRRGFFPHDLS